MLSLYTGFVSSSRSTKLPKFCGYSESGNVFTGKLFQTVCTVLQQISFTTSTIEQQFSYKKNLSQHFFLFLPELSNEKIYSLKIASSMASGFSALCSCPLNAK
jgi:hypothetical protein